jgi:Ca2+-binding RTX toxin-like protein
MNYYARNKCLLTRYSFSVADINITNDVLGADANHLEIFNGGLYIKAGTVLDFETKVNYIINVAVDDVTVGSTPDASVSFNFTLTDVIEVINGTNGSNNITGTPGHDIINGLGGNDTIHGGAGISSDIGVLRVVTDYYRVSLRKRVRA